MHEDLAVIVAVDAVDQEIAALRRRREAIVARPVDAAARHAAAEGSLAEVQARIDSSREEERALQRKMEQYARRRDTANHVLSTGLGDAAAAERQLQQCTVILDATETQALEVMETLESEGAAKKAARAALDASAAALATAEAESAAELPGVDAALADAEARRVQVFSTLRRDLANRYTRVTGRGLRAVSEVRGTACGACNAAAPSQQLADIRAGKRLEECRGCHRWLVAE